MRGGTYDGREKHDDSLHLTDKERERRGKDQNGKHPYEWVGSSLAFYMKMMMKKHAKE